MNVANWRFLPVQIDDGNVSFPAGPSRASSGNLKAERTNRPRAPQAAVTPYRTEVRTLSKSSPTAISGGTVFQKCDPCQILTLEQDGGPSRNRSNGSRNIWERQSVGGDGSATLGGSGRE
jgi:hypothetical protein